MQAGNRCQRFCNIYNSIFSRHKVSSWECSSMVCMLPRFQCPAEHACTCLSTMQLRAETMMVSALNSTLCGRMRLLRQGRSCVPNDIRCLCASASTRRSARLLSRGRGFKLDFMGMPCMGCFVLCRCVLMQQIGCQFLWLLGELDGIWWQQGDRARFGVSALGMH